MLGLSGRLPYLGHKGDIIEDINTSIFLTGIEKPPVIVDAFTGSGAAAYFWAYKGYKVIANDADPAIIALHKAIQETPNEVRSWYNIPITKKDFNAVRDDPTAFAGYVRLVWSFSNGGRCYLWAADKEKEMLKLFETDRVEPNQRREHVDGLVLLHSRVKLDIEWHNLSYEKLEIPNDALVYLDPPYKNTKGYKVGKENFDHESFDEWCLNLPNNAFISEYKMSDRFTLIDEYFKVNNGGGAKFRKDGVERLYCNKPLKKLSLF